MRPLQRLRLTHVRQVIELGHLGQHAAILATVNLVAEVLAIEVVLVV